MPKKNKKLAVSAEAYDNAPTAERLSRGVVDLSTEAVIYDVEGIASRSIVPRSVDILGRMLRRGSITQEMADAGERFREDFVTAQLDPLKCSDMAATRVSGGLFNSLKTVDYRDRVWAALLAVGGLTRPGGSCLWYVIGWERTLKDWALVQGWSGRRVSEEAASGILIAALGALESHYANRRQHSR